MMVEQWEQEGVPIIRGMGTDTRGTLFYVVQGCRNFHMGQVWATRDQVMEYLLQNVAKSQHSEPPRGLQGALNVQVDQHE